MMNLKLDLDIAAQYKNKSQITRVLTEDWIARNMFCPVCGKDHLNQYKANRPVADFFCDNVTCRSDFELKSKKNSIGNKISGGAYQTMIERVSSCNVPNFLFLTYSDDNINDLVLIPNHFFTPSIIEKRNPLPEGTRRAGWIGCYINLGDIPESGRIFIVRNKSEVDKQQVIASYKRSELLKSEDLESRTWTMDVLRCIERIKSDSFSIEELYDFESVLKEKHPSNNNIKPKIRQQLQLLRDKGFIESTTRGNYRKIKSVGGSDDH